MERKTYRLWSIFLLLLASVALYSADRRSEVRYAFLTDIHVSPGKDSEEALTQIVDEVNNGDFDFVILTGDLTNVGSDAELQAVKRVLSGLKVPLHVISGNHENTWSESVGETFHSLFGDDRFVFDSGKYRFLGMPTGPYMRMGNGHTKKEDVEWLKKVLTDPSSQNKILIVAAHYPLMDGIDNWYDITEVLKRSRVSFVMCGHGHKLSVHNFDGIPGVMGRATFTRTGPRIGGYNIVRLANDSAYVYEKIIGEKNSSLFAQFGLTGDANILAGLPTSARPDYSVNSTYRNVKEVAVIDNSASVFTGVACFKDGILVYGCSDGKIKGWDLSDDLHPKQIWEKEVAGAVYTTPMVAGDLVIAGTIDGQLAAYVAQTGRVKWRLSLGKPISGDGQLDGRNLYIGAGSDFYKIDVAKGHVEWKSSASGRLQASPLVLADKVIFGAWDTYLYCLDKRNGALRWKWSSGNSQVLYSPGNVVPVAHGDAVYIVAPDRYMTAIDINDGKTLWRSNEFKVRESIGISRDGNTIYAKTMNDTLIAIRPSTEKLDLAYALNVGYGYEHNPVPIIEVDKTIYLGTCEGTLIAIDDATRKIKWKHKCGNSAINRISQDPKGAIFVSLVEGRIVKIKNNFSFE
jgi:outer membrane protein assembly factor BamB/predicted MPP superfamily phosphohydrolase